MTARFTGRVALVTGAARGIGQAIAARLVDEGATAVLADVDTDAVTAAADELTAYGDVLGVTCDVTDRSSVDAAVGAAVQRWGRLDVLVNNVGVNGGPPFIDVDDEAWNRQADPTLHGAARCIQAALPSLLDSPAGGSVVSIGSVNGMAAFGSEVYSAAKAGLINLTQNLALRYGPDGVRFNVVAPGTVRTRAWEHLDDRPDVHERLRRLYPLGRLGEPSDIAAAAAFLASDDASWITGTVLNVDGGILAGVPGFVAATTRDDDGGGDGADRDDRDDRDDTASASDR
ncbi:SDR family NAD(P)-dependent oxidoreductase [Phytoactinopolyspora halophila]|uniref:SDR family NAD(P)-dependent oxidoreductase n=1 Tax=Phytoactinopolyspora halophila TaxID=1981511 RepID=UPI001B8D7153|nr:glucose 1-dehydrogenase [Phytoactinopolyspora halophila]